jgi:hypothetical protein
VRRLDGEVAGASGRTTAVVQQPTTGRACSGRKTPGAWQTLPLCVAQYSASFAGEQLHSVTTSVSQVLQHLRRFSMGLNKPKAPMGPAEDSQQDAAPACGPIVDRRHPLRPATARRWHLQFDFNGAAWRRLLTHRLARFCSPIASRGPRNRWQRELRPAIHRKSFSWGQGPTVVRLGTDASLDRSQNPHPCLLLHAENLPAAICASAGPSRLGGNLGRTLARPTAADSAVCFTLSSAKAKKGPTAFPRCYRSRLSRNHPSPKPWA